MVVECCLVECEHGCDTSVQAVEDLDPGVAIVCGEGSAEAFGQVVPVRLVPAIRQRGGIQSESEHEAVVVHVFEGPYRHVPVVCALVRAVERGRSVEEVGSTTG